MHFSFSITVVVAIFDIRSIFIGCFSITEVVAIFENLDFFFYIFFF